MNSKVVLWLLMWVIGCCAASSRADSWSTFDGNLTLEIPGDGFFVEQPTNSPLIVRSCLDQKHGIQLVIMRGSIREGNPFEAKSFRKEMLELDAGAQFDPPSMRTIHGQTVNIFRCRLTQNDQPLWHRTDTWVNGGFFYSVSITSISNPDKSPRIQSIFKSISIRPVEGSLVDTTPVPNKPMSKSDPLGYWASAISGSKVGAVAGAAGAAVAVIVSAIIGWKRFGRWP